MIRPDESERQLIFLQGGVIEFGLLLIIVAIVVLVILWLVVAPTFVFWIWTEGWRERNRIVFALSYFAVLSFLVYFWSLFPETLLPVAGLLLLVQLVFFVTVGLSILFSRRKQSEK